MPIKYIYWKIVFMHIYFFCFSLLILHVLSYSRQIFRIDSSDIFNTYTTWTEEWQKSKRKRTTKKTVISVNSIAQKLFLLLVTQQWIDKRETFLFFHFTCFSYHILKMEKRRLEHSRKEKKSWEIYGVCNENYSNFSHL